MTLITLDVTIQRNAQNAPNHRTVTFRCAAYRSLRLSRLFGSLQHSRIQKGRNGRRWGVAEWLPSYRHSNRLALLLLLLLIFPHFTNAADLPKQIGKIVAVRGSVSARDLDDGNVRELTLASPIFLNDQIQTGKKGRAQILFNDRSIISLGNNTDLQVSQLVWKKDSKDIGMKVQVQEGVFRFIGGMITKEKPDSVQVETPSATIGIRGSMYSARIKGDQLDVLFEGGKGITIQNDKGIITITKPGFGSQVTGRTAPLPPPTKYNSEQINIMTESMWSSMTTGPARQGRSRQKVLSHPPLFNRQDIARLLPANKRHETTSTTQSDPMAASEIASPAKAREELFQAIEKGISVKTAMKIVLSKLKNPTRASFDELVNEAIDQGLTAQQANEVVKHLQERGVCK